MVRGSLDSSRREIVIATASLATISVLLATGKVLSPQYLLWLLAPLALYAGKPEIVDRKVPFLMAAACALTTVVYPVTYPGLLVDDLLPWVALTLRNGCLWWLCILLVTRWYTVTRSSGPGRQVVVRGEELAR